MGRRAHAENTMCGMVRVCFYRGYFAQVVNWPHFIAEPIII